MCHGRYSESSDKPCSNLKNYTKSKQAIRKGKSIFEGLLFT